MPEKTKEEQATELRDSFHKLRREVWNIYVATEKLLTQAEWSKEDMDKIRTSLVSAVEHSEELRGQL